MALDLTNEELDALAERARKVLNAPSKHDAVRQALQRVVEDEVTDTPPVPERSVEDRLKALQNKLRKMGTANPNFDEKAFLDEMWEI